MFLYYLINKKDKPWYILTSNSTVVIDTSNLSPSRIAARWLISLPMAFAWNYPRSYCLSFLISILMIQIGDMSFSGQTSYNLFIYFQKICWDLGDDHLILSGGGWRFWSRQIIYFHHVLGRKIDFRVNGGRNIYFSPATNFWKRKNKGGG